jgi:hypothetical protein
MRTLLCLAVTLMGCRAPTQPQSSPTKSITTADILAEHGATGWVSARLAVGRDRTWVAAVEPTAAGTPKMVIATAKGPSSVRLHGDTADIFGGLASSAWLTDAQWKVRLAPIDGITTYVTLSITGETGVDLAQSRTYLALLDTKDGAVRWADTGAWEVTEMGRCTTGHQVKIEWVRKSDGEPEDGVRLSYRGFAHWTEQTAETSQSPDYARLERECKAPVDRVTRVPLTPQP